MNLLMDNIHINQTWTGSLSIKVNISLYIYSFSRLASFSRNKHNNVLRPPHIIKSTGTMGILQKIPILIILCIWGLKHETSLFASKAIVHISLPQISCERIMEVKSYTICCNLNYCIILSHPAIICVPTHQFYKCGYMYVSLFFTNIPLIWFIIWIWNIFGVCMITIWLVIFWVNIFEIVAIFDHMKTTHCKPCHVEEAII